MVTAAPSAPATSPEEGFAARFRAELARRPLRLVAACVVTALAPALAAHGATARATAPTEAPGPPPERRGAVAAAPGDAAAWLVHAKDAAATCPGLPPEVLVAVGHVETRLGQGVEPSPAGARGPMQFVPATWDAYGTDGDGDGAADIMNALDALHSAARLLCANGGADPRHLRSALWNYNHSEDYVDEVISLAGLAGHHSES